MSWLQVAERRLVPKLVARAWRLWWSLAVATFRSEVAAGLIVRKFRVVADYINFKLLFHLRLICTDLLRTQWNLAFIHPKSFTWWDVLTKIVKKERNGGDPFLNWYVFLIRLYNYTMLLCHFEVILRSLSLNLVALLRRQSQRAGYKTSTQSPWEWPVNTPNSSRSKSDAGTCKMPH